MEITRITPTPQQLKALSHPVRLRMLGILRAEGPATATTLAQRLGLNTGATSYHLRQLATHGFVEDDAGRGTGRERWWRAAHQSTHTREPETAEEREAVHAFEQSVAVVHTEMLQRAVEEQELLPDAWRRTTGFSDWKVRLTPRRAEALRVALEQVLAEVEEEDGDDVGDFVVVLQTYPRPGTQAASPS